MPEVGINNETLLRLDLVVGRELCRWRTGLVHQADRHHDLAANTLTEMLNVNITKLIEDLFMEREKDSTTVISSGLAIPHIIVKGSALFELLLVRSQAGIVFPGSPEPVHSVFVMASSYDERNFHLRALAAIAQIVQDSHFEKRWKTAKNKERLRDVILLGKRKRK